jgi:hypothetical protein
MSAYLPIDRLLQTLRVSAPGVTDDLLKLQIFNVADEFFRKTNAWRHEDSIVFEENVYEYPFSLPPTSMVVRVMGVTHNGIPVAQMGDQTGISIDSVGTLLPELTFPDGDASYAPVSTDLVSDVFSWAIYRPSYISITALPGGDNFQKPMKVILALTVAKDALASEPGDWDLPDWMFDTFFDNWLDGTLSRLFMMKAKPWSDQTLAMYHGRRFRNAMAFRRQEANRGYAYNQPNWRFPLNGRGAR